MDAERCVMCGDIIPEGRQVCPTCEKRIMSDENRREKKKDENHERD